ncbi:MAG TPA: dihydrolipoyl dehydrogenase [Myxococcota bacterium]|nr:dihydrolipoyl dehydrogenase [Myxococcota bacterium]HQK51999.1 dihydrolipoyl dehydrogenase [Myxococcota bacterium]
MADAYDLIVIGGGPGGYVAAIRAAQLGMRVACVEREEGLGGTCLRIGCIPSKALLESSMRFEEARKGLAVHGVRVEGVSLDLPALMQRKARIVKGLISGIDFLFKKNKVTRVLGTGRLAGAGRVEVDGPSPTVLEAPRVLIATGSRPASLPGVVFGGGVGTSTEALSYPEVPGHLVVIGAGAIGLELGSVWRRLGARVTVLEYLDRILPGTDADIAQKARKVLARQGLDVHLGVRVTSARDVGEGCVVEAEGMDPIRCDRVLVAVGRVPFTEGLGLQAVGIEVTPRGFIPVNERFETAVPGIFAVGDVVGHPMLAHKAHEEGIACVEGIATGHGHVNRDGIPAVCYTEPEVASVGRTEEQLREAGVEYRAGSFPFRANGRAQSLGETEGEVKVLADARTDRILGVHILGPRAGDLIAEAVAAMEFGASSEDLARTCHAHPTLPEVLREAALAALGRAIHA